MFGQLFSLGFMPILTRLYPPDVYGEHSYLLQLSSLLGVFITLRYDSVTTLCRSKRDAVYMAASVPVLIFLMSILTGLLLLVVLECLPLIADLFFSPIKSSGVLVSAALLSAVLLSVTSVFQNYNYYRQDYVKASIADVVHRAGSGALSGLFGMLSPTTLSIFGGYNAGLFLKLAACRPRSIRTLRVKLRGVQARHATVVMRRYSREAASYLYSHFLVIIYSIIPMAVMSRMYGPELLGQYSLAVATIFLPSSVLSVALGNVYVERAVKARLASDNIVSLWPPVLAPLCIVGSLMLLAVLPFGADLYAFVFGEQWRVAGEIAQIFLLPGVAALISGPFDRTCLVAGVPSYSPLWHSARAGAVAAVGFYGVSGDFSAYQLCSSFAAVNFVAYVFDFGLQLRFAKKISKRDGS